AASSTWSMLSARTSLIDLRTSSGMSRRSFSFFFGRITIPAPARCAARILDLRPPIGSTRPRSVISPVIATSLRTGMPVSADTSPAARGHGAARGGPGLVLGLQLAVLEARRAEVLLELLEIDDRLALAALGHRACDLAHDVRELTLEVPDAGLLGVGLDERRE